MSKSPVNTRRRLLDRARELFNEHGLEQVGIRELARDLGLSPGNVSYHFARKEDLVAALMAELREGNAATMNPQAEPSLAGFFERTRGALARQYEYRCIARSITHVVQAFPELAKEYRRTERERRRGLAEMFAALVRSGELSGPADVAGQARLVATCTLVARFWFAETTLSFPTLSAERAIAHYLSLLAQALLPWVTPKGRAQLAPYLAGVEIDLTLAREVAEPTVKPAPKKRRA